MKHLLQCRVYQGCFIKDEGEGVDVRVSPDVLVEMSVDVWF